MAYVYILYSNKIDSFYIGSCLNLDKRLIEHKEQMFEKGFTHRTDDWKIFFVIDNLEYQQARKIEKHIKKMKSRVFINNLKKYPEISERLIKTYK